MRYFHLILVGFFLIGCSANSKTFPSQNVFLFKDKDGLYSYDFVTKKELLIFKASDKQIFLDETCFLQNDTLTFGIKGNVDFKSDSTIYSKIYYSVDLKTKKYWIFKRILYEQKDTVLKIKSTE